jgi:hypothetical protein
MMRHGIAEIIASVTTLSTPLGRISFTNAASTTAWSALALPPAYCRRAARTSLQRSVTSPRLPSHKETAHSE